MTKREGFKSLAERLNPRASELGLVVEADKMFAELERRIAGLESDSHPPIDLAAAMDEIFDMRGYAPKPMLDPKTSEPEVTRQPLDDEWIKTVREAISTPAEPEVRVVTEEMQAAGTLASARSGWPGVGPNVVARAYLAMRALEPKRPVEITHQMVERAFKAYMIAPGSQRDWIRAALQAIATPPNEGETR